MFNQSPNLAAMAVICFAGVLNGTFAAPMKYARAWKWENIWAAFSLFAQVVFPQALAALLVPDLAGVYGSVASDVLLKVAGIGALWGIGCAAFGVGIRLLGMGLGFFVIMGISALMGTLLPLLLTGQAPPNAGWFYAGLLLLTVGLAVAGTAGARRDRAAESKRYGSGLLVCIASGILSSAFNIGFAIAEPVQATARQHGAAGWTASLAVWPLLLAGGFVTNLVYCVHLFRKNATGKLFAHGGGREWGAAAWMGASWILSVVLYGAGASLMGDIGPMLAWPMFTTFVLVCSHTVGLKAGEWRGAARGSLSLMNAGLALSIVAVFIIALGK